MPTKPAPAEPKTPMPYKRTVPKTFQEKLVEGPHSQASTAVLNAAVVAAKAPNKPASYDVAVSLITPANNPRKTFDDASLAKLAESIRRHGVLQPLLVRVSESEAEAYELIAGERRLRAAELAGLDKVPVRIVDKTDLDTAAARLEENLNREDLTPLDEAEGYQDLLDRFPQLKQRDLAELVGRSESHISNRLRLTRLPPVWQQRLRAGLITDHHAWELLKLSEHEAALEALDEEWKSHETDPLDDEPFAGWSIERLKDELRNAVFETSCRMQTAKFKADDATRARLDILTIDVGGVYGKCEFAKNTTLFDELQSAAQIEIEKKRQAAEAKRAKATTPKARPLDSQRLKSLWEDWFVRAIAARFPDKLNKSQRELAWRMTLLQLYDCGLDDLIASWNLKLTRDEEHAAVRRAMITPLAEIEDALIARFLERLRGKRGRVYFTSLPEARAYAEACGVKVEDWKPDVEFLTALPPELLQSLAEAQGIALEKSVKKQIARLVDEWQAWFLPEELDPFPKPAPKKSGKKGGP